MASRSTTSKKLGFIHIPKTGGTSIGHVLKNAYPAAWLNVTPLDFAYFPDIVTETPVAGGHIPLWIWDTEMADRQLFTILRDPVQRVISNYKYILMDNNHYANKYVTSRKSTISDCFIHPLIRIEMTNLQTKVLGWCPDQSVGRLTDDKAHAGYSLGFNRYFFGDADEAMLRRAIQRLQSTVDFAVLEEPATIRAMIRRLTGATDAEIPRLNTTNAVSYLADRAELDLIRQNNAFDMRLYRAAQALLAEARASTR